MTDGIRERGRYFDIIIEALADYDGWMLDDDYEATPVLNRIMRRMRERLEMSEPPERCEGRNCFYPACSCVRKTPVPPAERAES